MSKSLPTVSWIRRGAHQYLVINFRLHTEMVTPSGKRMNIGDGEYSSGEIQTLEILYSQDEHELTEIAPDSDPDCPTAIKRKFPSIPDLWRKVPMPNIRLVFEVPESWASKR